RPRPKRVRQFRANADLSLLADLIAKTLELLGHALVHLDDIVEGIGDFGVHARKVERQPDGEVTLAKGPKSGEQLFVVDSTWETDAFRYRRFCHLSLLNKLPFQRWLGWTAVARRTVWGRTDPGHAFCHSFSRRHHTTVADCPRACHPGLRPGPQTQSPRKSSIGPVSPITFSQRRRA